MMEYDKPMHDRPKLQRTNEQAIGCVFASASTTKVTVAHRLDVDPVGVWHSASRRRAQDPVRHHAYVLRS